MASKLFVGLHSDWAVATGARGVSITLAPNVEKAALDGLKFAACLPKELAVATLTARLRDAAAVRALLSQPTRVVVGG